MTAPVRQRQRIVVVGHGMVAHRFVESAAERGLTATHDITVVGDETRPAYDRVALTSYFEVGPEALGLVTGGRYPDPRIELRLGATAASLDRAGQSVVLATGEHVPYDHLVLATGAAPFVPAIAGTELPGVFVYRTIDDLESLAAAAAAARSAAVVGGGLLGLEAANVLRTLGLRTHVLERSNRPLSAQLDLDAGTMLTRHLEGVGLIVRTGVSTSSVVGDDRVRGLTFESGEQLETDLVVFATGVRPRDALAHEAGLLTAERGGIAVDERLLTADPRISAIGDCAAPGGRAFGLVAPGYAMADVVVDRLLGMDSSFTAGDTSAKLKLLGVDVASFGDAHGVTEGSVELTFSDAMLGIHKRLVLDSSGTRLLGGVLVGDASAYGTLRAMVAGTMPLPDDVGQLLLPAPEPATPPRTDVLEPPLCEHVDLTADELVEAVDSTTLTSFREVLSELGRGEGCDVCRTVVVSALVSRLATA